MPLRPQLELAATGVLRLQNEDGGIPLVRPGNVSGCWTTADVLYGVIRADLVGSQELTRVKALVDFLLERQLHTTPGAGVSLHQTPPEDAGGWPLAYAGRPSTMATGQAVAALRLCMRCLDDAQARSRRMQDAVREGLDWLGRAQNADGGWGTEPSAGTDGAESRTIAVFYALMAYQAHNFTARTPGVVRDACEWLRRAQDRRSGAWGDRVGGVVDVSSTARALSTLLRAQAIAPDSSMAKVALRHILGAESPVFNLWDLGKIIVNYDAAPGETSFNNNTVCDVLVAFMDARYYGGATRRALRFLLESQDPDTGLWQLSAPTSQERTWTWSTAEWIYSVDLAARRYLSDALDVWLGGHSHRSGLIALLLAALAVSFIILTRAPARLIEIWNWLPGGAREFMVVTIGVGVAVAVVGAAVFEYGRHAVRGAYQRALGGVSRWVIRHRQPW